MAAETEVRSGLVVGFNPGESDWDVGIENTLKAIARLKMGGGVLDRDLTAPPGSPTNGAAYIPKATATGLWEGLENKIVVWSGTEWVAYAVPTGFGIFIIDESKYAIYKDSSGWSTGVEHSWP